MQSMSRYVPSLSKGKILMGQSSIRVPDGIEGNEVWSSEDNDNLGEDDDFYGFSRLCKTAATHKVVSRSRFIEENRLTASTSP
jgi:hypothetical protein